MHVHVHMCLCMCTSQASSRAYIVATLLCISNASPTPLPRLSPASLPYLPRISHASPTHLPRLSHATHHVRDEVAQAGGGEGREAEGGAARGVDLVACIHMHSMCIHAYVYMYMHARGVDLVACIHMHSMCIHAYMHMCIRTCTHVASIWSPAYTCILSENSLTGAVASPAVIMIALSRKPKPTKGTPIFRARRRSCSAEAGGGGGGAAPGAPMLPPPWAAAAAAAVVVVVGVVVVGGGGGGAMER